MISPELSSAPAQSVEIPPVQLGGPTPSTSDAISLQPPQPGSTAALSVMTPPLSGPPAAVPLTPSVMISPELSSTPVQSVDSPSVQLGEPTPSTSDAISPQTPQPASSPPCLKLIHHVSRDRTTL